MTFTELFLADLEREAARSRKALAEAPAEKHDWKPHEKSMAFGYLANLVATIPSWLTTMVEQPHLDVAPQGGSSHRPEPWKTSVELLAAHDKAVAGAKAALQKTTDAHLMTTWQLLAGGRVVAEQPRHLVIRDTFNHLAHHRGQMTVYLRLLGAKVPALFGPSADDRSF